MSWVLDIGVGILTIRADESVKNVYFIEETTSIQIGE